MHIAARNGDIEMASLLIRNGADVNARNNQWSTSLNAAALKGHPDLVRFLWEQGAQTQLRTRDGRTPLHIAAVNGNTEVIGYLMEKGVSPRATSSNGRTAAEDAIRWDNYDAAELMQRAEAAMSFRGPRGQSR